MGYPVLSGADDGTSYHVVSSGSPRSAHSGAAEICCVCRCEEGGEGGVYACGYTRRCKKSGEEDTNPGIVYTCDYTRRCKKSGKEGACTSCRYAYACGYTRKEGCEENS